MSATATEVAERKTADRELFRSILGDTIRATGHGRWQEGLFTADGFYDAFRKLPANRKKTPGAFVASLHEVDDWMIDEGLERVP